MLKIQYKSTPRSIFNYMINVSGSSNPTEHEIFVKQADKILYT